MDTTPIILFREQIQNIKFVLQIKKSEYSIYLKEENAVTVNNFLILKIFLLIKIYRTL